MAKYTITTSKGFALPFGARLHKKGANFAIFSRHASRVWLLLFNDDCEHPSQTIELDPSQNKTSDIWHVWVKDIKIPVDVPKGMRDTYFENYSIITGHTGRLMLFAGDQKVEHLNKDFYGDGIHANDNEPEHLFKIAAQAKIGVFATQLGLIARYGMDYSNVPYLVKLNSKTTGSESHTLVIPELKGKMDAVAVRVPIPDGAITDIVAHMKQDVSIETVNTAFKKVRVQGSDLHSSHCCQ